MMKRTVAILLAGCLVMILAVGCSGGKQQNTATPTPTAQPTADNTIGAGASGTPSEFYGHYLEVKSDAIERVMDKIEADDDESGTLMMSVGMSLLGVTMVDLYLIPMTVLGLDQESSELALSMLGMQGLTIEQNGNTYSMSYEDEEGNVFAMTSEYDIATDSVKATIVEGENETMYFEYVKCGNGYAAQYYYCNEDDGSYELIKSYFDDSSIVACGFESVNEKPASIFKNSSFNETFVENDELYVILEGDVLTVFEDGETSTY